MSLPQFLHKKMLGLGFMLAAGLCAVTASAEPAPDFTLQSSTGENIRLAEQRGQVVMLNFWASWCGPCRIIAPVIEELAGQYEGRVKVAKVNVDDNPATSGQFRVMSIPTMILFKDGQPVEGMVGAQPKRAFESLLDKHLGTAVN